MKKTFTLIICSLFCICPTRQLYAQLSNVALGQLEDIKIKAEKGDAEAQCRLGTCYRVGQGVETNYVEAVKWYRKAAEQNYAAAQTKLGMCYFGGLGVPQDFAEAVKWFQKAADQNFAAAQFNLALC